MQVSDTETLWWNSFSCMGEAVGAEPVHHAWPFIRSRNQWERRREAEGGGRRSEEGGRRREEAGGRMGEEGGGRKEEEEGGGGLRQHELEHGDHMCVQHLC